MNLKMSKKVEQAMAFHDKGYNCAQAVACSFCEEFGIDQETMFRVSEGFAANKFRNQKRIELHE